MQTVQAQLDFEFRVEDYDDAEEAITRIESLAADEGFDMRAQAHMETVQAHLTFEFRVEDYHDAEEAIIRVQNLAAQEGFEIGARSWEPLEDGELGSG